jgi:hypothetical protein
MSQLSEPGSPVSDTSTDSTKDEVWFETPWDQSLPSLIRGGMAVCELFPGASAVFKNVNPDTFHLPLHVSHSITT